MRGWRCWCWALCLLTAGPAQAQAETTLSIRLSGQEYPPYIGERLPFNGIMSRLVTEAFARANVKVSYVFYPNNRAISAVRNGAVDASLGWAPSAERLRDLKYSERVLTINMVFYYNTAARPRWDGRLASLAPYRIGTTVGNFYSDEFNALLESGNFHADTAGDDLSNLRKLQVRRIDLFPIEAEVGAYLLARHFPAEARAQFAYLLPPFWSAPLHVVVWRGHPQADELVARFNRGLHALRASGDFERLVADTRRQIMSRH